MCIVHVLFSKLMPFSLSGKSPRIWNLSQPTAKNNHETFDPYFLGHYLVGNKFMLVHQIIFTSTSFADNFMYTIIPACLNITQASYLRSAFISVRVSVC